jgi:hypothetical protein
MLFEGRESGYLKAGIRLFEGSESRYLKAGNQVIGRREIKIFGRNTGESGYLKAGNQGESVYLKAGSQKLRTPSRLDQFKLVRSPESG